MTPEPTVRSRLREITEGPVRDLPTPEETLKAEAKAKVNREKAAKVRIPMMSAGHSEMMSATGSDPSRPAVPIDVGRVAHRPLDWFGVSMVLG
jgi:hypothetical protein